MRSLLYVPGNRERMLAKAGERGADGVIIDLEDAVPASEKDRARDMLSESVVMVDPERVKVLVRVNSQWSRAWREIEAAVGAGVQGIILPKVSSAAQPQVVGEFLDEIDPAGRVALFALVEDARGLLASAEIARATARLRGLIPGNQDLALQLGISPGAQALGRLLVPLQLAAAASGIGLYGSIGGSADFGDAEAWRTIVGLSKEAGFDGVTCIHPDQVAVINELFTPDDAELASAKQVIEAYEAAGGGPVSLDGAMVDLPVYLRARRLLGS